MSNVSVCAKKVGGLYSHRVNDADFIREMESYYSLLMSNYGPKNGKTLIRNSAGCDYLTSSSQKILQQLPFFHPFYKFINALIEAQNKTQGAHGLYVGALCSGIIMKLLKTAEFVSHRVISEVSEWIQNALLERLLSKPKFLTINIELDNLGHILCFVKTVLHSKSWYSIGLTYKEREDIAMKIVEAFLKTIPEKNCREFGGIHVMNIEESFSTTPCIFDGILYRLSDYDINDIQLKLKGFPDRNLNIIIFNVPLSHDTDEKHTVKWKSTSSLEHSFSTLFFQKLMIILRGKDVHIIASQKYIQESLKYELEKEGYIVLERLGTKRTKSLLSMCNCCPINSLSQIEASLEGFLGSVSSVKAVLLGEKTYINILPYNSCDTITFILTGVDCHAYDYLKETIENTISMLQRLFVDSSVVAGGGCFETFAALNLVDLKQRNLAHLSEICDSSFTNVSKVFDSFVEIFVRLSVVPTGGKGSQLLGYFVDSVSFHLWKFEGPEIPSEDMFEGVPDMDRFCSCKCINIRDLPPGTRFMSLLSVKNSEIVIRHNGVPNIDASSTNARINDVGNGDDAEKPRQNFNASLSEGGENPIRDTSGNGSLHLRSESIVDSFAAKVGATRMSFDGVSELLTIGRIIFDK